MERSLPWPWHGRLAHARSEAGRSNCLQTARSASQITNRDSVLAISMGETPMPRTERRLVHQEQAMNPLINDPHARGRVVTAGPKPEQAAATIVLIHGRG